MRDEISRRATMQDLMDEGWSYAAVAAHVGCSPHEVRREADRLRFNGRPAIEGGFRPIGEIAASLVMEARHA